jgi:hypothetical protein
MLSIRVKRKVFRFRRPPRSIADKSKTRSGRKSSNEYAALHAEMTGYAAAQRTDRNLLLQI